MDQLVTLTTPRKTMHLAVVDGNAAALASAPSDPVPTTTKPVTDTGNNRIVIPGVTNYLKFIALATQNTSSNLIFRIWGWSYVPDIGRWCPTAIGKTGNVTTANTTYITNNAVNLGWGRNTGATTGDLKAVQTTANEMTSFIADPAGAELIEFTCSGSATPVWNIIWGEV
jgi:hypothetical protein